jgi:hypothetical protein
VTQIESKSEVDNWPSDEDQKLLHEAAVNKKKTVVFSDGREYSILYSKRTTSIAWGKDGYEIVYICPTSGEFVPCGWFHVNFLNSRKEAHDI